MSYLYIILFFIIPGTLLGLADSRHPAFGGYRRAPPPSVHTRRGLCTARTPIHESSTAHVHLGLNSEGPYNHQLQLSEDGAKATYKRREMGRLGIPQTNNRQRAGGGLKCGLRIEGAIKYKELRI